jgi:hypothetical protein
MNETSDHQLGPWVPLYWIIMFCRGDRVTIRGHEIGYERSFELVAAFDRCKPELRYLFARTSRMLGAKDVCKKDPFGCGVTNQHTYASSAQIPETYSSCGTKKDTGDAQHFIFRPRGTVRKAYECYSILYLNRCRGERKQTFQRFNGTPKRGRASSGPCR